MGRIDIDQFLTQYKDISSQSEIHISNVDMSRREDQLLVLGVFMRGKTVEQYFDIFHSLRDAYYEAEKEGKRERMNQLCDLSSAIMALGERALGIDWQ
jgi:NCAIR mutase (PurE)-related protein